MVDCYFDIDLAAFCAHSCVSQGHSDGAYTMKNYSLTLIILLSLSAMNAARAGAITDEVKQRVQADLQPICQEFFFRGGLLGYQSFKYKIYKIVFATAESGQYCGMGVGSLMFPWEHAEKQAIANCETMRSGRGSPCEVYAHDNDIIYVSIHEKLKVAKELFEAGDISAAEFTLNEVNARNLSALTPTERGEFEYLFGKVLINSKSEQDRAEAIPHLNNSWANYGNVNAAVEEGNARMMAGDIEKDWHWQPIRAAYNYFLTNASDEKKSLHPEVAQNLKQTEPYYQADLVQKDEAVKEQARLGAIEAERKAKQQAILEEEQQKQAKIDAIKAKHEAEQQAKQDRLNAIKVEREAEQQEKIRQAEAKRQAIEGDGSADDKTCKSYGARMGTPEYINCRIQLRTKQTLDEQQAEQTRSAEEQRAAQTRAANEQRAAQEDYNRRLLAAQQAEQAQRAAENEKIRQQQKGDEADRALSRALIEIYNNSKPPPPRPSFTCTTFGNMTTCN